MQTQEEKAEIDLSNLYAIADGDPMFVMALLSKMCKALPLAFTNMQAFTEAKDWPALKSAAHKAKSIFAYLSLDDMRYSLKNIEHGASEEQNLDNMPRMVAEAIEIGNVILAKLQDALAKLM